MFSDISKVILLSDMDGTLLTSKKQITDRDRAAIEKFTSLGGKFTVATGRTIQSFEQFTQLLDLKITGRLSTIILPEKHCIRIRCRKRQSLPHWKSWK